MAKLDPNAPIDDLDWESHDFFRGAGQSNRETADLGRFEIERWTDPEGEISIHIYHKDAIRRAAEQSMARGGGVLGLSSSALHNDEHRILPKRATIGDALKIATGLTATRRAG